MKKINIYLLRCPVTKDVKYIGSTKMSLKLRLTCHIHEKYNNNALKYYWIKRLKEFKLIPIIECVELVEINKRIEKEKYWINYYLDKKIELFNINEHI